MGTDMTAIANIIAQLESCQSKDWRLDDLVNSTLGQVRRVSHLNLGGMGRRTRYFGPNADPNGRGSPVPSPTRTAETRRKAIEALRKLEKKVEKTSS